MFNKLSNFNQRELKTYSLLSNLLYVLFLVVFPVIYACSNINIVTKTVTEEYSATKFPFIALIILVFILLFGVITLTKRIEKISILQLDGTYNEKAFIFKMIFGFIVKAIPFIIILVIASVCGTKLCNLVNDMASAGTALIDEYRILINETINFYVRFIVHICSFIALAVLVDKTLITAFSTELEIRAKVSERAAIDSRIANLTNLK